MVSIAEDRLVAPRALEAPTELQRHVQAQPGPSESETHALVI